MITQRPWAESARSEAWSLTPGTVTGVSPDLDLEERVLEVLARWDRRLERAAEAWDELGEDERHRREAELDAAGETAEWVLLLWNWWTRASPADQAQLRRDVSLLYGALWAAAADGRLDTPTEEASSARHLLGALERIATIVGDG
jgi:hypothetical protein